MTTNKVTDIRYYSFSKANRLFLDANIWLSVYGPLAYKRTSATVYSRAIRDIRLAGCSVFLDALVMSEFVNVLARWEYRQSPLRFKTFKQFRQSPAFKPVAEDIANNARRILKQCRRCDSCFPDLDIEALLCEFQKGNSDFNDQMLCEICREKKLTMVTDDPDFGGSGLTILTANSRLLSP